MSETDSDSTTCCSDWVDEDVHVVLDSHHSNDSSIDIRPMTPVKFSAIGSKNQNGAAAEGAICRSTINGEIHHDSTKSCMRACGVGTKRSLFSTFVTQSDDNSEQGAATCSTLSEQSKEFNPLATSREVSSNQRNMLSESSTSPSSTSFNSSFENDLSFDDHTFHRPKFSHSPSNKRRPLMLTTPGISPSVEVPAMLNQYLRDYQQSGVRFLYNHYISCSEQQDGGMPSSSSVCNGGLGEGAILCDDMGLGKTIQVIAFMSAVLGKKGNKADVILTAPKQAACKGCFLVVCPGSVLYNWKDEIETWSHLKYSMYHRLKKDETMDKARRHKLEVVLTTHETARTNIDDLNTVDWLAVICDEVHVIKSPLAQVTVAMNSLKAKKRYGLTGTALQNNLSELWCILNWANPGCLRTLSQFQNEFEQPILEGQKYDCTKRQLASGRQKLAELKSLMKMWVLRRTKSLIASQLPQKEEFVVFCPVTELQESIYQEILDTEDVQLVLHAAEPCNCYSGRKRGGCCYALNKEGVAWQKLGHAYTILLTKCANHLGLMLPSNTTSAGQIDKSTKVCSEVFAKHPQFLALSRSASFLTLSDTKYCGKMQVLERLLAKFREERAKVILFSLSVILLNIIENYIVSRGYMYCRLDGSTKIEDRASLVRTFNTDPNQFIFIISKKCGGVGLNVTGANRVIIFDPSWNPATDMQAEDRAFRIGQSRDVKVYRFVTEGTVEEMIYLRQVYKQQLANMAMEGSKESRYFTAVAGDKSQPGELFGYSNLWPLRKPGQPGFNLTMDLLKRAQSMEDGIKIATDDVHRLEGKNAVARQIRESESDLVPGATTIAHSGGKSVVGSSRAEEYISKAAFTEVYQLEKHSQDPANCVTNKLEEFSDESDDVDYEPTQDEEATQADLVTAATDSLESVESPENKLLRHKHFGRMAEECGYPSSYEFALHVHDLDKGEREALLNKFYGSKTKGSRNINVRGKRKRKDESETACVEENKIIKKPIAKSKSKSRQLPTTIVARQQQKRKRTRKPLEFEDCTPPSSKTMCLGEDNNDEEQSSASVSIDPDQKMRTVDSRTRQMRKKLDLVSSRKEVDTSEMMDNKNVSFAGRSSTKEHSSFSIDPLMITEQDSVTVLPIDKGCSSILNSDVSCSNLDSLIPGTNLSRNELSAKSTSLHKLSSTTTSDDQKTTEQSQNDFTSTSTVNDFALKATEKSQSDFASDAVLIPSKVMHVKKDNLTSSFNIDELFSF